MKYGFKVLKAKKYVGSLITALAISTALSGCTLPFNNNKDNNIAIEQSTDTLDNNVIIEKDNTTLDNEIETNEDAIQEDEKEIKEDAIQEDSINSNKIQDEDKLEDDTNIIENTNDTNELQDTINNETSDTFVIPDIGSYQGISIVEALALVNANTSFNYRMRLAEYFGISNYKGTASQNILLIEYLRNYSLGLHMNDIQNELIKEQPQNDKNQNNYVNNNNNNSSNNGGNNGGNSESGNHENKHHHNYRLTNTSYRDNSDGSHQVTKTYTCTKGDSKKVETTNEACSYGNWISNTDNTQETRTCSRCGHTETRTIHNHTFGSWSSKNDTLEHRTCTCGYEETRSHSYDSYEYVDINHDEHVCSTCDHRVEVEHNLTKTGVNSSNTVGKHIEEYSCSQCGHTDFEKNVECTLGDTYYSDDLLHELNDCTVCHDIAKDTAHTHNYGEWEAKDENNEIHSCDCSSTETRSHTYGSTTFDTENNRYIQTCSTCGYVKEITVTHTHSYDEGTKQYLNDATNCYKITYRCTDPSCNHEYVDYYNHPSFTMTKTEMNGNNADYCYIPKYTCTDSNCGYSYTGNAVGHDFVETDQGRVIRYDCNNCDFYYTVSKTQTQSFSLNRNMASEMENELSSQPIDEINETELYPSNETELDNTQQDDGKVNEEVIDRIVDEVIDEYIEEIQQSNEEIQEENPIIEEDQEETIEEDNTNDLSHGL